MKTYIEQLKQRVSGYLYTFDEWERGELEYEGRAPYDLIESGIEVGIAIALRLVIQDLEDGVDGTET